MEFDVKVLFISRYDFKNDSTGEVIKGCKVTFIDDRSVDEEDQYGKKVITVNVPYEDYSELRKQVLPFKTKAVFEQVSLDKKPKFKKFIY